MCTLCNSWAIGVAESCSVKLIEVRSACESCLLAAGELLNSISVDVLDSTISMATGGSIK